jgi:F-box protein 11
MSYTRFDDSHDAGYLSQLRERLSNEVRGQSGAAFAIFQDTKDIEWGQQFAQRIAETLKSIIFFIPILTPNFFNSEYCREELRQFLERETQLQRHDLILPVYYLASPVLEDPTQRANDDLAQIIAERQRVDWRDFRFESLDAPAVRRRLAEMATRMRDVMQAVQASEPFRVWQLGGDTGNVGVQTSATEASPNPSASAPGAPPPATPSGLTPGKRQRLEQERNALQQEWEQRHKKKAQLSDALTRETDAAVRFKLEHQVAEEEERLKQLGEQIDDLDKQLD